MGLGIIGRILVRVGAARVRAHQPNAGAAGEGHWLVVAINNRDVVVILRVASATDGVLGQRCRRLSGERAGESTSAVAAVAVAASTVEGTAGAAPEPAAGAGRHVDGPCLAWVQLRAPADRDACRPHCVTTIVLYGEGGCACTGSEGGEEEEDRGHASSGRH